MAPHDARGNFIMPDRWTPGAGVIFDGAAGQVTNDCRVIDEARRYDFPMSTMDEQHLTIYRANQPAPDYDHAADLITQQGGIVDGAVEWLNEHAAPAGHWFVFDDGDFRLIAEEVESGEVGSNDA